MIQMYTSIIFSKTWIL